MKKLFVFGVAALLLLGFSVSVMAEEEVKEIRIGSVSSITGMSSQRGSCNEENAMSIICSQLRGR